MTSTMKKFEIIAVWKKTLHLTRCFLYEPVLYTTAIKTLELHELDVSPDNFFSWHKKMLISFLFYSY